jgi:hypothetical protein
MRGRAAAIGRSVNDATIGDHRKLGGQLRGKQYGDVGSAQSDQSAGALAVHTAAAPLRRVSAALPRVRSSVRRTRETRRSTTDVALCKPHLLQLLGFEDMILLRTGGLAASPPVRYTLETAEQCLAAAVARYGALFEDGSDEAVDRLDALFGRSPSPYGRTAHRPSAPGPFASSGGSARHLALLLTPSTKARQWWWPWRPRVSTGVAPGRVHCGTGRLVGPQVATPSPSERQYQHEWLPSGQPSGLSSHASPRP